MPNPSVNFLAAIEQADPVMSKRKEGWQRIDKNYTKSGPCKFLVETDIKTNSQTKHCFVAVAIQI